MTVSTLTSSITYQGNAATTLFTFPFPAVNQQYLQVTYIDASGNTTAIPSNQYSVTLNPPLQPNPTSIGGSITYPLTGPPIPSGSTLTISRVLPATQGTSLANQSTLYQAVVEAALDYITMLTQQNTNLAARAMVFPTSDPSGLLYTLPAVAQRQGQFVTFDGAGNVATALPTGASATISTFMQPFCNSPTLGAAQTFLGINQAGYVPVGAEFPFAGISAPQYYFMELGQNVSRTGFPELFNVVAPVIQATITSGSNTATVGTRPDGLPPTTGFGAMTVEAGGILPVGTTITSLTNTTVTFSANAIASGTSFRIFPFGNGNGTSTYTLPDSRGRVDAGLDPQNGTGRLNGAANGGSYANILGWGAGEQAHVITWNEMAQHQHSAYIYDPSHTHPFTAGFQAGTAPFSGGLPGCVNQGSNTGAAYTGILVGSSPGAADSLTSLSGSNVPHNNVQPTATKLKIIYAGRATF